jgi:hypothetical protein
MRVVGTVDEYLFPLRPEVAGYYGGLEIWRRQRIAGSEQWGNAYQEQTPRSLGH